jgi:hypothetical protein
MEKEFKVRLRFEGRMDNENKANSYLIIRDETSSGDVSLFKGSVSMIVMEEIAAIIERYED